MDPKPWWQSTTIRGLVVTLLGVLLPPLLQKVGLSTPDQAALAQYVGQAFAFVGVVLAVIGRMKAAAPLK